MQAIFLVLLAAVCITEIIIVIRCTKNGSVGKIRYIVTPTVLFLCFLLALYMARISLPYAVLLLCMATVFLHTFVGLFLDYYSRSKIFDRYLHGFGSFSFALVLYLTLAKVMQQGGSVFFRAVFVAALGIAAGTVFEIMEFTHDSKSKIKMQRGLKDTNFDLLCNIVGSVAAALLSAFVYLQ